MKRKYDGRRLALAGIKMLGVVWGTSLSISVMADKLGAVIVEPGKTLNVNESANSIFLVNEGATLNVNGAEVKQIEMNLGVININGGSVLNDVLPNSNSLEINGGLLTTNRATISNTGGMALSVGSHQTGPGSKATVVNSTVTGMGTAALVGIYSELTLRNSSVSGGRKPNEDGVGVRVSAATLDVQGSSVIRGDDTGITVMSASTLPGEGISPNLPSSIVIDNSVVEGGTGAAIRYIERNGRHAIANISIQNNSTLLSGNGNILEVDEGGVANFTVDNSRLDGNLTADETSTLNVTLQNNAQLNGDIINSDTLAINSGARWQMVGDGAANNVSLNGGTVNFAQEGFHTLSLSELSGNGTFGMRIDLDNGVGDLLKVSGQSSGNFGLKIINTGVETVSPELEPLKVVDTEGGDAQFYLVGGKVDLGAYSYLLQQQGDDWFVVGNGKTISPSTQSVLALFNAAPTIWMSELATLRSRMGEVRGSGEGGGWMRGYGNRFNATTDSGVSYRQQQKGFSLGADAPIPVSNGQLLVGLMGGYSQSDLDVSRGTSGTVNSYYVGAYTTWLSEDGYYLDGVLKFNRFRNQANVAMSDATKAKGSYSNGGFGGSVEFGKHIKLADDYFLEPFAQLASVLIQGDDYALDNGLSAKNSRTQSVLGKVGTTAGRSIELKDGGLLQPYVRVAVAQEFSRSNDVQVNDSRFSNDLFGSRAELGAGVAVSLSKRLQLHADFDYMNGKHVEQPWGANVGLRFAF